MAESSVFRHLFFGTINKLVDDGGAIIGLTSRVETSPDIPEINLDAFCS